MSVACKYGLSLVLAAALWTVQVEAQEADDLRLDTGDEEYGVVDDVDPPPPPPPDPPPLTIRDEEPAPPPRRREAEDAFGPEGVKAGEAFLMFPEIRIESIATSNARRNANGDSDVGLRIRPSARLQSDWSRHQFTASASADVVRYLNSEEAASTGADLNAALRLDVRRGTELELESAYSLSATPASDSEVPDTATGARRSHTLSAGARLSHDFGGLQGELRSAIERQTFNDVELSGGGVEDNSDRNQTELRLAMRGTLRTGGKVQPFAEVSLNPRFRDATADRNGLDRDSTGYGVAVGVSFADEPFWSGDIAATYLIRDYADASLDTVSTPGVLANILWRPTEFTSVNLSAQAELAETSAAGESARKVFNFGIGFAHELRENLTLSASTALTLDEGDATFNLRAGAEWEVNPLLAVNGSYEGAFSDDFTEHRLLAGVTFRK